MGIYDCACKACHGSGTCQRCDSMGRVLVEYGEYGTGEMTCPVCDGTRKCNECGGSGDDCFHSSF